MRANVDFPTCRASVISRLPGSDGDAEPRRLEAMEGVAIDQVDEQHTLWQVPLHRFA